MLDRELHIGLLGQALARNNVDYVLVGGAAVVLQGGDTTTHDLDITFDRSDANIEQLAQAIEELSARPKRWQGEANYRLQSIDLRSGWLHMESDAGDIDLVVRTPGVTYADLKSDMETLSIEGTKILIASPKQLLTMKQHANREKDQRHITEIETLIKLRSEGERQRSLFTAIDEFY